ncbi:hypothetical protein F506_10855 [Herbaspirillum hiltneri N3]|uniref:Colicin import membrane protein n=1 Tax=Herbaspirillum hiltneri N3 TaxID=1262470 RepID=A0ABM5V7A8_9BURK|nr:hypothetical protein [Herbaspirillum hiltneri]AKZ65300.1 hypothetical protein F506_10855 [Herbaspirillum hiltneri N3]
MQSFFYKTCCAPAAMLTLAVAGLALPLVAAAEPAPYGTPGKPPFNERYPSGSIRSTDEADKILAEADKERLIIEDQYIAEQRDCYKRFFVTACLDGAKERNRVAGKQVRDVEVEANTYKRQAKADDRDKSLAEQRVKDEQDSARRAADQKERDAAAARKVQESAAKQEQVKQRELQSEGKEDARVKAHEAQMRQKQAADAAKAPQREANEKAYQEKVKAAEVHRKEVEANKAEKARERAAKQQQAPASGPAVADPNQPR